MGSLRPSGRPGGRYQRLRPDSYRRGRKLSDGKAGIRKNGDVVHTNSSLKCRRREDGSVDYFAAMIEEVTGLGPSPAGGPAGAWEWRPGTQVLSGRELEVTRLIGFGRTVKEIAAGLALSEKTISTYRTRILTKLNLKSTAELMRYALKNRIAE